MKTLALMLSLVCCTSFSWAIVRLLSRPAGITPRMRLVSALGVLFSGAQIAVLASTAPSFGRTSIALTLYVIALGLFWCAVPQAASAKLNIAFTDTRPAILLTNGPYAYVRHPFYASYLLYWAAGAAMSTWLWPSVLIMGSFYAMAIVQEENSFRHSPLAATYTAYQQRTGALVPVLWGIKRK